MPPTLWLQSAELRPSARQNRETGARTRFQQKTESMAQPATETPPSPVVMTQLLFGKQLTYSLSAVARLGVADHMDAAAKPVEEIAAKADAPEPALSRVMPMLASLGVFKEGPPRHFALTPLGELLKTNAPG